MNSITPHSNHFHIESTFSFYFKQSFKILVIAIGILLSLGALYYYFSNRSQKNPLKEKDITLSKMKNLEQLKNKHSSMPNRFVGVEELKKIHKAQLEQFESWAKKSEWQIFSRSHFDWWMFPIQRNTLSTGMRYTLSEQDIDLLKNDLVFMQNYRRGVELLLFSWGWDIKKNCFANNGQHYDNHETRLGKIADSLLLFKETKYHTSLQNFVTTCNKQHSLPSWVKSHLRL